MITFRPNFSEVSVQCPNPHCSGRGNPSWENNESFRRGYQVEVDVVDDSSDDGKKIASFVLSRSGVAVCRCCNSNVVVPCLFRNEKVCLDFWARSGRLVIKNLRKNYQERIPLDVNASDGHHSGQMPIFLPIEEMEME